MKLIEVRKNCQKEKQEQKNKGVYSYIRILLPSCSTFKSLNENIHGYI